MKILLTGCNGFIGFSLAKKLLENKENYIVGVDNLSNYYSVKLKKERLLILDKFKNFTYIKEDLSKLKNVNKIFSSNKFEIIIHFAAQPGVRRSFDYPSEYYESNVSSFFNIIECSKKFSVKKIFFASSSSVYGDTKKFPVKEDFDRNPKNFYAQTKCINEDMAKLYSDLYNIKMVALRFFTVYGPYGRPDMLMWKLCQNILSKSEINIHNFGNHERDFTYIDDVVNMLIEILKIKKMSNYELFNICSNKPIKLIKIIKIFLNYGKINDLKYKDFQRGDVIKTHGSNIRLLKKIKKIRLTSIEQGIKNTFNWFKQSNYNNKSK